MTSATMVLTSPVGPEITIDGRRVTNFAGSPYLGLGHLPPVLEAGACALKRMGSGYQFARLYGIATEEHLDAETAAAEYFGSEAALYTTSGYSFALAAISALKLEHDCVYYDEYSHTSIIDGASASGLPSARYHHLDAGHLRELLSTELSAGSRPIIATDGVFSTRGQIAPIRELLELTLEFDGTMIVDESHSFGVLGQNGRGASEEYLPNWDRLMAGGSTGKGLGVVGGLIPSTSALVERIRAAPAVRSSSVGLPAAAKMCAVAIRYLQSHPEIRTALLENSCYVKAELSKLGLVVGREQTPVVAFSLNSADEMAGLRDRLFEAGINVLHSFYGGAGENGVIRCAIFADHRREHLDQLINALRTEI